MTFDRAAPLYLASPQAMTDLRALNAQFIENFVRNDVTAHGALLHRDFIYINSTGKRIERARYLEAWAHGFDPNVIVYWDVRDEKITLVGNVALVRATNKEIVQHGGKTTTSMATYTDTYLYQHGAWYCLQAQITAVAPEHEPGEETIVSVYLNGVKQLPVQPPGILGIR